MPTETKDKIETTETAETQDATATATEQSDSTQDSAKATKGTDSDAAKDKATTEEAPAAPAWTPRELSLAKAADWTEAELNELPPEKARAYVDKLLRTDDKMMRNFSRVGRALQLARDGKEAKAKEADPNAPPEGYSQGEWDDMPDWAKKTALRLAAKNSGGDDRGSTDQDDRDLQEAEEVLTALDPELYGTGKGATGSLDELSPEYRQRMQILAEAKGLILGHVQTGQTSPSVPDAIRAAARIIVPAAERELGRREAIAASKKRAARVIARPSGVAGRARTDSPEKQAAERMRERARELGVGDLFT